MATTTRRPSTAGQATVDRRPYVMLGMATVGFVLTFWAWALLSPLGAHFKQALGLTSFQQALIVAVPVIVGALGRIPVGALTDRYGGRLMFPVVSFATIVPVLFLGLAGRAIGPFRQAGARGDPGPVALAPASRLPPMRGVSR